MKGTGAKRNVCPGSCVSRLPGRSSRLPRWSRRRLCSCLQDLTVELASEGAPDLGLVDVIGAAVAPGGQQEQRSAEHRQHVADDRHPEAPAEVGAVERVVGRVERLAEVVVVLGRVRDGVVRRSTGTGTERRQRASLQQRYRYTSTHTVNNFSDACTRVGRTKY